MSCLSTFQIISYFSANGVTPSIQFFMTVYQTGFLVSIFMTNKLAGFFLRSIEMFS